jgi:hypothetical protein
MAARAAGRWIDLMREIEARFLAVSPAILLFSFSRRRRPSKYGAEI